MARRSRPAIVHGYAVIRRVWKKGDRIDLELPMPIQKVIADPRVAADSGRVALRYGPLLFNVETADNGSIDGRIGPGPLRAGMGGQSAWRRDDDPGEMGGWDAAGGDPQLCADEPGLPYPDAEIGLEAQASSGNQPQQYQPKPPVSLVWIKE